MKKSFVVIWSYDGQKDTFVVSFSADSHEEAILIAEDIFNKRPIMKPDIFYEIIQIDWRSGVRIHFS